MSTGDLTQDEFNDFLKKLYEPPPVGTPRHFYLDGRSWRVISGSALMFIQDETTHQWRFPTLAEAASAFHFFQKVRS